MAFASIVEVMHVMDLPRCTKTSETVLGGLIVVDHPVFFDTFVVSTVDDKTLRSTCNMPLC